MTQMKQSNEARPTMRRKGYISPVIETERKDRNGEKYKARIPGMRRQRSWKLNWQVTTGSGAIFQGSFSKCMILRNMFKG
jgi:hypothetical protein